MEMNPYRAPEATVAEIASVDGLAQRGTRLAAAIIDSLILLALWMPVLFFTGYFRKAAGGSLGFGGMFVYSMLTFLAFVVIQGLPLARSGQTWGKRILGIRIVTMAGEKPSLGRLLFGRYLPVQLVGAVPLIGILLTFVNVLFIFRADRRCVHDLVAGTKVVEA